MKLSMMLQEGRARIADPKNWWDGHAKVPIGEELRMCAVTAMTGPKAWSAARGYLNDMAIAVYDETAPWINDKLGHAAVMELYDIAISLALSDEAAQL
jgi:hypothetical protein